MKYPVYFTVAIHLTLVLFAVVVSSRPSKLGGKDEKPGAAVERFRRSSPERPNIPDNPRLKRAVNQSEAVPSKPIPTTKKQGQQSTSHLTNPSKANTASPSVKPSIKAKTKTTTRPVTPKTEAATLSGSVTPKTGLSTLEEPTNQTHSLENATSPTNTSSVNVTQGAPTELKDTTPPPIEHHRNYFPVLFMAAMVVLVALYFGYFNRRKIHKVVKTGYDKAKLMDGKSHVKAKLEEDKAALLGKGNKEYIY